MRINEYHFILAAAHLHTDICPLTGNYALSSNNGSNNCSSEVSLSSGCHQSHRMKLTTACTEEIKGEINKTVYSFSLKHSKR